MTRKTSRAIDTEIEPEAPPRRRGRPCGFDREAALTRAIETFWARGYEGTSIADLTQAMGITAPSLYAAFGSKAALYREALDRYRGEQGASAAQALAEEPTLLRALTRMFRGAAHDFTSARHPPGCMISTAVLTCAEENRDVAAHVAGLRAASLGLLQARIEQAVAAGELPADTDARALARYYGAILHGMSVQAQDGATTAELLAVVERALRP